MEEVAGQDKAASMDNLKDVNFLKSELTKVKMNGLKYDKWTKMVNDPNDAKASTNESSIKNQY